VLDLLEEIDLLEHLSLAEVVLHVGLLDSLDGHLLPRQLVHPQSNLTEGTLADELDELVEVEGGRRQLVVLLDVLLDVLDQLVTLLEDGVVDLGRWLTALNSAARGGNLLVSVAGVLGRPQGLIAAVGVALGVNLVEVDVTPVSVVVARLLVRASCVDDSSIRGSFRVRARGLRVFSRPGIEEGVGGARGARASVRELLLAAVDLNRHGHPAVVRDPPAGPSRRPLGLRPPILVRACRVLRLIVQRG
jgi:hypothetical protein